MPGFSASADDWCIPALRDHIAVLARTDEVRIIALRYPAPARRYRLFGAEVIALGAAVGRGIGSAGLWHQALLTLAAEQRRRRFDVLHAFWATESGAVAAAAGRILGVPTLVSLAGGELARLDDLGYGDQRVRIERLKVGLALHFADAVSTGSDELLRLARPWLSHRPAREIHRLPLGVDLARFPPAPPECHTVPRLIQVASLVPVKDQATLLRSLASLRQRGLAFKLDLVGTGPLEPSLRARGTELGLADLVHFIGAVEHDRLPERYAASDLFVLSSRHEAQGMAPLEAAASARAVVGTRVGIIPELGPGALSVPTGDPEALADGIAELLRDPERRCAMGEASRARVEAEFTLERCVWRFRQVYQALADNDLKQFSNRLAHPR